MIDQFAKAVCKKIRVDLNTLADQLASGSARTIEEYRETCGRIRGLAQAEEYILEMARKAEESDSE